MIMHECIKCDFFEMIPCAQNCPIIQKYECPQCHTIQYIKHSRIDPETFSEDMVEVDEENHSIKLLTNPKKK